MFSIIATPSRYEQIKTVVQGQGSVLYGKAVKDQDIIKAFAEADRVNSSVLVVDIDAGSDADVVRGVKKYKVARPHTRIILLAPGRKPGDLVVSQLLAKGVYDIAAPGIPEEGDLDIKPILEAMLEQEAATYSDAVRWDVEAWGDDSEGKKHEQAHVQIQTQTVYMEKYIGTGFICVVGARRGVGCTTMAAAVANYLASEGKKKVALVELTHYPGLQWVGDLNKSIDVFTQSPDESVKLFYDDMRNLLEEFSCQDYDFVVLDMGVVFEPETDREKRKDMGQFRVHQFRGELLRAGLTVMVSGSGSWDYVYFDPYLRNMEMLLGKWTVVSVGDPGKSIRGIIEEKTERVMVAPYVSGPLSSELYGVLRDLLFPYLPKQVPEKKRSGLWG